MEEIRDELSKCELLCSAVWHDTSNAFENEDRSAQAQRVSNLTSALSFASLSDSSTLFLPIYSPCPANSAETAFRRRASWNDARTLAARVHPYWDSAFVALRLRSSDQTASTLTSRLNWRSDTPISLLEGIMPLASLASTLSPSSQAIDPIDALLASRGYGPGRGNAPQLTAEQKTSRKLAELRQARVDLSGSIESLAGVSAKKSNPATETRSDKAFASATTARGLATSCSEEEASTFSDAVNKLVGCEEPWSHLTTSTLAYNEVRRSYPALRRLAEPRSASQPKQMQDVRTSHSVLSTLRTSPRAATHLRRSLSTVQEALTGHLPLESWGLDSGRLGSGRETGCVGGKEGLGEVKERLYELLGAYEEEEFENDDLVGTDEERADEKDELDWD
ncbi:hypothetical protein IE81DRAFT_186617 [Ceraceosorus guamensis]|uniref:Uncharacterized protein n=1 Tax=Ceraceosorus guamensis TaxID=1522189 RepID=A0A316W0C9_9BASI|nr:hypothetical protein IE81DRAFT_186617 [Ceraceosorus guamensis]PWN41155.1 hypothetical protein IE81DRAFT_186617 [Ceraceosorus guamensis]